jgi:hypothetical protein
MNNYHLFLIRSDQVTQIVAHLTAGIVTLVLIFSVIAQRGGDHAPEARAGRVAEAAVTLPEGTGMIAAVK